MEIIIFSDFVNNSWWNGKYNCFIKILDWRDYIWKVVFWGKSFILKLIYMDDCCKLLSYLRVGVNRMKNNKWI